VTKRRTHPQVLPAASSRVGLLVPRPPIPAALHVRLTTGRDL